MRLKVPRTASDGVGKVIARELLEMMIGDSWNNGVSISRTARELHACATPLSITH